MYCDAVDAREEPSWEYLAPGLHCWDQTILSTAKGVQKVLSENYNPISHFDKCKMLKISISGDFAIVKTRNQKLLY